MKAILLSSLLLLCAVAAADDKEKDKPHAPKLPIGKDTTYVTGPLDKHGFIDYEVALNAEMSKRVAPEKNAMAVLILALGPAPEGGDGLPIEYFKWLDIPIPPKEGDYLLGSNQFLRDKLGLSGERLEAVYNAFSRVNQRPWAPKDVPPLAEWVKANDKPLAVVIEAVKRPDYFNPLVTKRKEGESSNLIGALLPTVQKSRELATLLCARAMLSVQEKKYDDAWRDILACHRLGRLVCRGATLIESLVGVAVCQIASNATLAYLAHADLTAQQTLARLKELQALPPAPPMADKIDLGERMMGLDATQLMRRQGGGVVGAILEGDKPTREELKAFQSLDWTPVMQTMNKSYDRMAAAMRLKDRAAREKEFDAIEKDLAADKGGVLKLPDPKKPKDMEIEKVMVKNIGVVLMRLLAPAVRKVQGAQDRISQVERNLHAAFALAAYRKDNDRYPAKLADLAPKYLAAVPDDIFSGKALIYKPSEKGYLVYSVGPNGKDDGGQWVDDDPPGDDPRVKMPLPEIKVK